MSWLHKSLSTCGRYIAHPEKPGADKAEEVNDEAIPVQDQIENLRAKIQLKERYNRALTDDLEESHAGATSYLRDLTIDTTELRHQLIDAINSEKAAVQNALRTHREFQLALTDRTPNVAVPWLDDKLFGMSKKLNAEMDELRDKRQRLEDSEALVVILEKWPRAGSQPWEIKCTDIIHRLECLIEAQKVRRETARILHATYYKVKIVLRGERGKYPSVLNNMQIGLNTLKTELTNLRLMLDDAIHFRDEAYKNLVLTEKESSENRRIRRKQMAKMKKAVERILQENANNNAARLAVIPISGDTAQPTESEADMQDLLRKKREEVEEFQERARKLVDAMRVKDLTLIPNRLKSVRMVGTRLREEQGVKEKLRDLYTKQKAQLTLILFYHRYTGEQQYESFLHYKKKYENLLKVLKAKRLKTQTALEFYGNINAKLRLGVIACNERLSEGRRTFHPSKHDLQYQMRVVLARTHRLVDKVEHLGLQFQGKEPPARDFSNYVKIPQMHSRLVRVGTPAVSDESDGDEDITDSKVPGRLEIKNKSLRVIHQSILRRGLQ